MTYVYDQFGDKLENISDNSFEHTIYDFKDAPNTGQEFFYDENGNNQIDLNKELTINYNDLNLIEEVSISTNNPILYTYDAQGNKLIKNIDASNHYYCDGVEYDNDVITSISTPFGRVRPVNQHNLINPIGKNWAFDYFIKDHIGNIRAVVTEEKHKIDYVATMEDINAAREDSLFENISLTRINKPSYVPLDFSTNPHEKVSKVNNIDKIGVSKILELYQGDVLSISTKYFYQNQTTTNSTNDIIQSILNQISLVFASGTSTVSNGESNISTTIDNINSNQSVLDYLNANLSQNLDQQKPQAFLTWLYFDKNMNFVSEASGTLQTINPDELDELGVYNIKVRNDGFMFVYVSNNSTQNVIFDNLQINQTTSVLIQSNDYYPFGMLWETSRSSYLPSNNYKFSSQEFESSFGLNMYDFGARHYDPSTGRWIAPDPLQELTISSTPYKYGNNNPVRFFDKFGLYEEDSQGELQPDNDDVIYYDHNGKEVYRTKDPGDDDGVDQLVFLNEDGTEAYHKFVFNGSSDDDDGLFGEDIEYLGEIGAGVLGLADIAEALVESDFKNAAEKSGADGKKIKEAADQFAKDTKILKWLGAIARGFGILSALDHGGSAIENFEEGHFEQAAMDAALFALDVTGVIFEFSNPIALTVVFAVGIADANGAFDLGPK